MKKTLTAETAETAEKKILRILGELCVLCGKTSHFFTRSEGGHYVLKVRLKADTTYRELKADSTY